MATRKPTFKTGTPAIQPARALDLRTLQQSLDNIRERFINAEAQVAFLQRVADSTIGNVELSTMRTQLAALTRALNVLQSQVTTVTGTEIDVVSLILMQERKMRAIASDSTRDLEPPNSANAVLMHRMFNRR